MQRDPGQGPGRDQEAGAVEREGHADAVGRGGLAAAVAPQREHQRRQQRAGQQCQLAQAHHEAIGRLQLFTRKHVRQHRGA
ncbi:hypothetical protein LP420_05515 [Massilia sp. B-10]|nr:hypothetical protein LP420_05515 [Massilia sp. B-10]